ncbi:MAG: MFS transporter [Spirochaetota bacterium]
MADGGLFRQGDGFPAQLTSAQRATGQHRFRSFLLLNGVSVALLMENMLILFAIRNGASDPVVAVIASFIHLTMPAMIIGKKWVSRFGLSRTMGLGWFLRYASASLMVFAPLAAGLGLPVLGIGLIVTGAFGFAFFRSIGAIANTPLTGEITTPGERGGFIAGNMVRIQSTHIVTMVTVVLLLRVNDSLPIYQGIIAAGCLVGFYASTVVARVPESVVPQRSAEISLVSVVKQIFSTPRLRRLFFGWCAGFVSFAAVIPFAMITVKNGYGVSDYEALFFSLVLVLGAISSALLNGLIADRVGPRPLVIIYLAGLVLVAGFWAMAPRAYLPVFVGVAFYVAGICKTGIITGLGHYFLSIAQANQRVGAGGELYRFLRTYNTSKALGVAEVLPDIQTAFDEKTVERIESESDDTNAGMSHLRRALREIALRLDGEHAFAISELLGTYDPPVFPRRLAFALAIILSAIQEEQAGGDGSGALGPRDP